MYQVRFVAVKGRFWACNGMVYRCFAGGIEGIWIRLDEQNRERMKHKHSTIKIETCPCSLADT